MKIAVANVASAFAAAFDVDDYLAANRLVAHDCSYDSPTGQIDGAGAILDPYESVSANRSKRAFAIRALGKAFEATVGFASAPIIRRATHELWSTQDR